MHNLIEYIGEKRHRAWTEEWSDVEEERQFAPRHIFNCHSIWERIPLMWHHCQSMLINYFRWCLFVGTSWIVITKGDNQEICQRHGILNWSSCSQTWYEIALRVQICNLRFIREIEMQILIGRVFLCHLLSLQKHFSSIIVRILSSVTRLSLCQCPKFYDLKLSNCKDMCVTACQKVTGPCFLHQKHFVC